MQGLLIVTLIVSCYVVGIWAANNVQRETSLGGQMFYGGVAALLFSLVCLFLVCGVLLGIESVQGG